jgi:hypothetical protein
MQPGPTWLGSVPTSRDLRSWRSSQHSYRRRRGHVCEQRPLSYPRRSFHGYARTREVPGTQQSWTTLSRTLVTTMEDQ